MVYSVSEASENRSRDILEDSIAQGAGLVSTAGTGMPACGSRARAGPYVYILSTRRLARYPHRQKVFVAVNWPIVGTYRCGETIRRIGYRKMPEGGDHERGCFQRECPVRDNVDRGAPTMLDPGRQNHRLRSA